MKKTMTPEIAAIIRANCDALLAATSDPKNTPVLAKMKDGVKAVAEEAGRQRKELN